MNNKNIITILIIAVVTISVFYYIGKRVSASSVRPQPTTSIDKNSTIPPVMPQRKIDITDNGFSPDILTVKKGGKVVWTNNSSQAVSINSDPHPAHTLYPILNIGVVDTGNSASVTFENPGTYTYHNHFKASQKGKIIVE